MQSYIEFYKPFLFLIVSLCGVRPRHVTRCEPVHVIRQLGKCNFIALFGLTGDLVKHRPAVTGALELEKDAVPVVDPVTRQPMPFIDPVVIRDMQRFNRQVAVSQSREKRDVILKERMIGVKNDSCSRPLKQRNFRRRAACRLDHRPT